MITLRGIRKRFGPQEVLKGVDLDVHPGRVTAVVGPNGAGKTTLIKMILGLVKPDAGEIRIHDHRLNGDWRYRASIGYMPQIVRFPENLTGREIAAMLTDLRSPDVPPDLELVESFGLEDELDKPFRTLSGGTRQKMNASIAFRFRSEVMVLDEPTAGLDPVASRILREKIRRERDGGRTFLVTSHDMGHLNAVSDDVLFLLEGRVAYQGTIEDLKSRTGEVDLEGAIAAMMLETDR